MGGLGRADAHSGRCRCGGFGAYGDAPRFFFLVSSFYGDAIAGDDSNDGETAASALKTLAAIKAKVGVSQKRTVRLRGYPRNPDGTAQGVFYEQLYFPRGTTVEGYGGERAIVDGSRVIPSAAWGAYEGNGVVFADSIYRAAVTTEFTTSPQDDPIHSNTFHCATWVGEDRLTGHLGGASIADNLAAMVADSGSSFTAHLQGSIDPDPRVGDGGTEYFYYVKLADGSHPGDRVAYAEQAELGDMNAGTWRDLELRRTAFKDMVSAGDGDTPVYGERVIFRDAAIHGPVGGPAHWTDCEAYALPTSRVSGGGGFHFFHDEVVDGVAPPSSATRCKVGPGSGSTTGFRAGFYSHGIGTGPQEESVTLTDCEANACAVGVVPGWSENGWTIEGLIATNCPTMSEAGALTTIKASDTRRSSYTSPLTGNCVGISLFGDVVVEGTDFVFQTSGTRTLSVDNSEGDPFTVDFINCTFEGLD